jgi:hypothetical protein
LKQKKALAGLSEENFGTAKRIFALGTVVAATGFSYGYFSSYDKNPKYASLMEMGSQH